MATRYMIGILRTAVEWADNGRVGAQQYWPHYENQKGVRQLIDRLVNEGLVTVEPDNHGWEDYRRLAPTEAGRALLKEHDMELDQESSMSTRRKRSHMTEEDCFEAMRVFSGKVERMLTGSHGVDPGTVAPENQVTVCFSVRGSFGVADDLFEAVRVLGGHKLPAHPKS